MGIVDLDGKKVFLSILEIRSYIKTESGVPANMLACELSIDIYLCNLVRTFEIYGCMFAPLSSIYFNPLLYHVGPL